MIISMYKLHICHISIRGSRSGVSERWHTGEEHGNAQQQSGLLPSHKTGLYLFLLLRGEGGP